MKKILIVLTALFLMISMVLPLSAENGKVIYDGNAQKFIFTPGSNHSPTDLFPDFKGVMPGDTIGQKIFVKNEASNKVKVKIYLRSLGAHSDSTDFLSQLGLTVQKNEATKLSYLFDATADKAADLSDWVCLGTLYSGGEVDLDVILSVPVELDNQFQNQIGYLDWEFKVEEYPIDDSDPKPPPTNDSASYRWLIPASLSLITVVFLSLYKKRNEQI